MKTGLRFLTLTLMIVVMTGCAAPAASPTAAPSEAAPNTLASTLAPVASEPPLAVPDSVAPSDTPAAPAKALTTPLPQPTPTLPAPAQAFIQLRSPGESARVTSPVIVRGESNSTFEQNLVIKVYGEDGKELVSQPTTIQAELGQRGPFEAQVAFQVDREQPGRVAVMDFSAKDGSLLHLTSVEVTLMPSGDFVEGTAPFEGEFLQITRPEANIGILGGLIRVEGVSQPVFEQQVNLAVCGEGGSGEPDPVCGTADNVLGMGIGILNAPDASQPGRFVVDLNYTTDREVKGTLVVYTLSPRDGGITHLNAIPLTLQP